MASFNRLSGRNIHPAALACHMAGAVAAALVVTLFWAAPGRAQPIRITSGEHADFTRVVLQSPQRFDWNLTERDGFLELRIPTSQLSFDRDRLFQRIPRTRLAGVDRVEHGLEFVLLCPCPVRIWEDRAGVVVLDIRDPEPDVSSPPPPRALTDPASPAEPARAAGLSLARSFTASEPPLESPDNALPSSTVTMERMAQELADRIAATMGGPGPEAPPGDPAPPPAANGLPGLPSHVRLRDSSSLRELETDPASPSGRCPESEIFGFAARPDMPPFAPTAAELRARLYGEFDLPDQGQTLALAEHYLGWGFGAEARQLLEGLPESMENAELLVALADILEGRVSNSRHRLSGYAHCPGPVALFAVLAGGSLSPAQAVAERITGIFMSMPEGLRRSLGPDLIHHLADGGAMDQARMALTALAQIAGPDSTEIRELEAALEYARGNVERAIARLDPIARDRVQAMRMRLDIALEEDEALSESLLADAAAIAGIRHGSEAARETLALAIRHHAAAGRVLQGFEMLDSSAIRPAELADDRAQLSELRNLLWHTAAQGTDAAFLNLVLTRNDWRLAEINPSVGSSLRTRLDGLGLGTLAGFVGDTAARNRPETDAEGLVTRSLAAGIDPTPSGPGISFPPFINETESEARIAPEGRVLDEDRPHSPPVPAVPGEAEQGRSSTAATPDGASGIATSTTIPPAEVLIDFRTPTSPTDRAISPEVSWDPIVSTEATSATSPTNAMLRSEGILSASARLRENLRELNLDAP